MGKKRFTSVGNRSSNKEFVAATGNSVVGTSLDEPVYKNFLLQGSFGANNAGYNFSLYLDNNQYPLTAPPLNIGLNISLPADVTPSTDFVISWMGRCGSPADTHSAGLCSRTRPNTSLRGSACREMG
jgi:hypothetical protein